MCTKEKIADLVSLLNKDFLAEMYAAAADVVAIFEQEQVDSAQKNSKEFGEIAATGTPAVSRLFFADFCSF